MPILVLRHRCVCVAMSTPKNLTRGAPCCRRVRAVDKLEPRLRQCMARVARCFCSDINVRLSPVCSKRAVGKVRVRVCPARPTTGAAIRARVRSHSRKQRTYSGFALVWALEEDLCRNSVPRKCRAAWVNAASLWLMPLKVSEYRLGSDRIRNA